MSYSQPRGGEYIPRPFQGERRKEKECFNNALFLALEEGYQYCEGVAISGKLLKMGCPILMDHAWCCDDQYRVIDPTWKDVQDGSYWGMDFDPQKVADLVAEKGTYGLFSNPVGFELELIDKLLNNV